MGRYLVIGIATQLAFKKKGKPSVNPVLPD